MNREQVRRNVVWGALASYLRIAVRLVLGLVTFRLLYQYLSPEEFGWWSLLWALFGYGILLDFGFGFAAQKRVADLSVRQDWDRLSGVLSTIFFSYLISAAAAALLGLVFAGALVDVFGVGSANRESFRVVLQVFLVGVGLAFPLGLFPEILRGQQRVAAANAISLGSIVSNCACVVAVVWLKASLLVLVVLTLVCVLVPWCVAAWLALRAMPKVRIRPGLCSLALLVDTGRFGIYAYLNLLSGVVRDKADQPVLSALLGVAALPPYQPGSRIADMFGLMTRQIAEVLSPAAAHLHARGDGEALRRLLVDGMRVSVLAATPLYLLAAAYMDGLLRLMTGLPRIGGTMYWSGQLLLFWYYSLVLTHAVFKRMFFMAGQERRMMIQGVVEAAANLTLSVLLTLRFRSILGVAWGSVIPTVLLGWLWLWPWAAREAGMSSWRLFRHVVLRTWFGCVPLTVVIAMLRWQPWWVSAGNSFLLVGELALAGAIGGVGLWRWGLNPSERIRLLTRLRRSRPLDAGP